MLPFEPQEMKDMVTRYHEAVATTNDIELIQAGKAPVPSKDRKHVFDFQDGMRIIVSVDNLRSDVVLHVSCSVREEFINGYKFAGSIDDLFAFLKKEVERRLAEMRGSAIPHLEETFISEHGVLHLMFIGNDEQLRAAVPSGVTA